jgi:hypothetical protein
MRSRFTAIAALVIAGFGVPLVARACDERPAVAACRVTILDDHIAAVFPIFKAPSIWRWSRASTADNALEYRWMVEFGACSSNGLFEKRGVAFGVQLFKFPGDKERSGSFADLLQASQADLLRREQTPTGVSYARVEGIRVSGAYQPGAVTIEVDGKSTVGNLTSARPLHALLSVNGPDPGQSYTCFAEVEYK